MASWSLQTSEAPDPASLLGGCVAPLNELADQEQVAWERLRDFGAVD